MEGTYSLSVRGTLYLFILLQHWHIFLCYVTALRHRNIQQTNLLYLFVNDAFSCTALWQRDLYVNKGFICEFLLVLIYNSPVGLSLLVRLSQVNLLEPDSLPPPPPNRLAHTSLKCLRSTSPSGLEVDVLCEPYELDDDKDIPRPQSTDDEVVVLKPDTARPELPPPPSLPEHPPKPPISLKPITFRKFPGGGAPREVLSFRDPVPEDEFKSTLNGSEDTPG